MVIGLNSKMDSILEFAPTYIIDKLSVLKYSKMSLIVCQDDTVESVKFLVEGKISIENIFNNGNKYAFTTENDFTILGDIEILSKRLNYVSSVIALSPVTILSLPLNDFYIWLKEDKRFLLFVTETIAEKAYNSVSIQGQLKYITTEQRLLYKLYLLYSENSVNSDKCIINYSHLELAQNTGMSERTLNRYLQPLLKNNIIESKYRKLIIRKEGFMFIKNSLHNVLTELNA